MPLSTTGVRATHSPSSEDTREKFLQKLGPEKRAQFEKRSAKDQQALIKLWGWLDRKSDVFEGLRNLEQEEATRERAEKGRRRGNGFSFSFDPGAMFRGDLVLDNSGGTSPWNLPTSGPLGPGPLEPPRMPPPPPPSPPDPNQDGTKKSSAGWKAADAAGGAAASVVVTILVEPFFGPLIAPVVGMAAGALLVGLSQEIRGE